MKRSAKRDFPVHKIRRYLEPGPIVLVTSAYKGERNVMTMGWHTVMEFSPSLVGCIISSANHSFEMIRKSRQCVINIPTVDMAVQVAKIGNCSGADIDKFAAFGLTTREATKVRAPLIDECPVSLECKLYDANMVDKYNFFILEVVKAHAAASPKIPDTLHYMGEGQFTTTGKAKSLRRYFTKWPE